MRDLTTQELDQQLAEQLPARELMGSCYRRTPPSGNHTVIGNGNSGSGNGVGNGNHNGNGFLSGNQLVGGNGNGNGNGNGAQVNVYL